MISAWEQKDEKDEEITKVSLLPLIHLFQVFDSYNVISRSGSVALSISRPNKNPGYDMFTFLHIVYS